MKLRDELLSELAANLSDEIAVMMVDFDISPESMVDAVLPEGSPGSQFHRPFLLDALYDLLELDEPLDLLTCLQVCDTYGWVIGVVEDLLKFD